MTSRLTLSALVFSIFSTAVMVWSAEAATPIHDVSATRYVQLERVTIVASRSAAAV